MVMGGTEDRGEGAQFVPDALFGMTTGARVAEYIRTLIWNGTLRAGDRVRQNEIASALGVSRVPVREGLVAVESEGLVRHEPQRGVFVARLDRRFVRDHYAILGLVLGYVIEHAANRGDGELKRRVNDLSRRLASAKSAEDVFPLGVEFKELVNSVGGSARSRAAVAGMERLVPGNMHEEIPGAIEVTRSGITRIGGAIEDGDGLAAAAACREMTSALGQLVVTEMERRHLFDTEE
jgi:DNA-binding GntR family transcriptional regulator